GILADPGEVVGHGQAALAARPELAERRGEVADLPAAGVDELFVLGQLAAGVLLQRRLRVERVDLRGAAVHHQEDAGLGLGGDVRLLRGERPGRGVGPEVRHQAEAGQGDAGEPAAHLPEELAPGQAARERAWHGRPQSTYRNSLAFKSTWQSDARASSAG